ncbi:N-6 DNA methylase [Aliidongia sp.]|uniref:N-6 DNA methylase n=1 Tax=Aliidongia sp. TaxID=1914230 RepID=UPI002DDD9E83|nr:N-6 DNA methylase [Aliidongia sp.]
MAQASARQSHSLLNDLLLAQGWDLRRPPHGDCLSQLDPRVAPRVAEVLLDTRKRGAATIPAVVLVDRLSEDAMAVVASVAASDIASAMRDAQHYAAAFVLAGQPALAIGLAGVLDDDFCLRVSKWDGAAWCLVTHAGQPINWIPTREDARRLALPAHPPELRPSIPPPEVLAARAEEINRLLREANVKDEFRPAVVAAIMLALWQSRGAVRRDERWILEDINTACRMAFTAVGKAGLADGMRIDSGNGKLAGRVLRIALILERLNVTMLTAEHDYLGQLYETLFRYTGANTIGQYFTPRHIARMMVELCAVRSDDIVLDPTCGTGGFLIAGMDHIRRQSPGWTATALSDCLHGFESEPVTAALCIANMILRGDGSAGIHQADVLTSPRFRPGMATVVVTNPPFPHKKTDTPSELFVDRALEGLRIGGRLAVILPTSLLVKRDKAPWRARVLRQNSLLGVCQLPDELFQPFAAATTSIVLLEKGRPHDPAGKTAFVRLHHDGLVLRRGARVERPTEPNHMAAAVDALLNKLDRPGFSGSVGIAGGDEWAAGAYIRSAPPDDAEMTGAVDVLQRRLASFYTRYAPEILAQRDAIADGEIAMVDYRQIVSHRKLRNAEAIAAADNEIGGRFDIFYGFGAIESREGIPPGRTLIVSPTEQYNGCDGWLEFPTVLAPPFITVARTGSIGEAFVHLEPCAPNSDCLVLLPRKPEWAAVADLLLVASAIRLERWRYGYGRKITPARIAPVNLNFSQAIRRDAEALCLKFARVIDASLAPYRP